MPDKVNNFGGSLVLDFKNDDIMCKPRIEPLTSKTALKLKFRAVKMHKIFPVHLLLRMFVLGTFKQVSCFLHRASPQTGGSFWSCL